MKPLFVAVYNKFDGDAPLKAAVTDLYLNSAPQDTAFPYLVMLLVSDINEETFTSQMDDIRLQFSIFSKQTSAEQANDIFTKLKAVFDNAELTLDGFDHIRMRRDISNLLKDPDEAWHYVVEYKILIQKAVGGG